MRHLTTVGALAVMAGLGAGACDAAADVTAGTPPEESVLIAAAETGGGAPGVAVSSAAAAAAAAADSGAAARPAATPTVLALVSEPDSVAALTIDAGSVYFTGGRLVDRPQDTPGPATEYQGFLQRVPATGGPAEEVWRANLGAGAEVRAGADALYFLTYDFPWRTGRLFRLPRGAGQAPAELATWRSHGSTHSLTVDDATGGPGDVAYWTHSAGASSSVKRTVGATGETTVLADQGFGSGNQIVRLGDLLYFIASETFLYEVPISGGAGGTPRLVWQAQQRMTALDAAPEDGVLYLAADGQLLRIKPGANPTIRPIVEAPRLVTAVAADGNHVYWTQVDDSVSPPVGEIWRARRHGGGARLLAGGQARPMSLAFDAASIYWVDAARGAVLRAPK